MVRLTCYVRQGKASQSINWSFWARIKVSAFTSVFLFLFLLSDPLFLLELDNENLNSAAKQKWKPSASKQQCLEAYEFVDAFVMLKKFLTVFFLASRRAMSEIIQGDEGETSGEIVNLDEPLF